jgi:hypothetical protein
MKLIESLQRTAAIEEQLEKINPKIREWYLNERAKAYDSLKSSVLEEFPDFEAARIKFQDTLSQALYDELVQIFIHLKQSLRRYRWGPKVELFGIGLSILTDYGPSGSTKEWENWCVEGIMQFAEAGILSFFRRCRQCGEWLEALPESRKYCGDNCRQKFASQSSEFKDKRRVYMRNYRKRERDRDERVRRLAKARR